MNNRLEAIFSLGTERLNNPWKIKELRLVNSVSFLISILAVVQYFVFFYLGLPQYALLITFPLAGFLFPLYGNQKGWYKISKISIILSYNISILIFGMAFGKASYIHITLFGFACFPFLFYRITDRVELVSSTSSSAIICLFLQAEIVKPWEVVSPQVLNAISLSMLTTTGIIVWQSLRYLIVENGRVVAKQLETNLSLKNQISINEEVNFKQIELLKRLESKNKSLDEFAYIISHDLKSPLIAIESLVGLLKNDLKESKEPRVAKGLLLLEERAKKLQHLVGGILEYSRSGTEESYAEEVDLRVVLSDLLQQLNPLPDDVEIGYDFKVKTIVTDRLKFGQIFQNLITNAINHRQQGSACKILVTSRETEFEYIVSVKDNGPGIDPKYQHKIFRLFERLSTESKGSSGIGLSIVKKMVESEGGNIRVVSRLNEGCKFSVAFPKKSPLKH